MKTLKFILVLFALSLVVFFIHFNNTKRVNPIVVSYYSNLKESLKKKGYTNSLLVISTKRSKWENYLFENFSAAAHDSRHLTGEALDILVLDVNSDFKIDSVDVAIVFHLLDKEIVMDKGGVGTYLNTGWFTRQMIHFDCRGERIRWNY